MKKFKYYALFGQCTGIRPYKYNEYDEWLEIEGTYQECLKTMTNIQKGYIMVSNEDAGYIRYSKFDPTRKIVKTKGWK